jgi:hypothetical protein
VNAGILNYGLLAVKQLYLKIFHIVISWENIFSGKNGEDKYLLI